MHKTLVVAAIGLAALACDKQTTKPVDVTPTTAPATTTTTAAAPKAWSDSQVLATITAINQGEVDIGNAALPKLTNKDAKDFATMMVKDHTDGVSKLNTIAAEQHIEPMDNETSLQLKTQASSVSSKMAMDAAGAGYDRAYMTAMVEGHQKALDMIDANLLSNAANPTLRDTLRDMRGKVQDHLSKAQSVLQGLPSSS